MTEIHRAVPKWILIVAGIIALLEIMVSISLVVSPASVMETVDLNGVGVQYLIYMWAARQFALGFIFAFATFKQSAPMLTLAFIFFLVMMLGDLLIGISQKENGLIMAAIIMAIVSSAMIFAINKKR